MPRIAALSTFRVIWRARTVVALSLHEVDPILNPCLPLRFLLETNNRILHAFAVNGCLVADFSAAFTKPSISACLCALHWSAKRFLNIEWYATQLRKGRTHVSNDSPARAGSQGPLVLDRAKKRQSMGGELWPVYL